MKIDLTNKIAIITGGNRGIGLAIAQTLGEAGATIILMARNQDTLAAATDQLKASGIKAFGLKTDVSNAAEVNDAVPKIIAAHEHIDIVVNNAGVTRDNLLMRMGEDDWQTVMDINLRGAFNLTKSVVRPMMKQRSGRIINITSVVGLIGNAGQANYAASKAGLIGFTKSMAKELASRNVTVNAVAPGFINTDMTSRLTEDQKQGYLKAIPLGRFGDGRDVANVVLFIASDLSQYMTGQVFVVDGGMVM